MFDCQFFGYAVTYNDSFSSPHSHFCAFFCPCLEKLPKLEIDRTISPAVNQMETHFPTAAACSAISQRWNHCTKLFCQKQLLFSALSTTTLHTDVILLTFISDWASFQALWHLQQIASLFLVCLCSHGILVSASTCLQTLSDCCTVLSLVDLVQQT